MTDGHTPTQTTATVSRPPLDDEISLWEILAVLLRRRGTILVCTVAISVLAVTVTLLSARTFTTEASFRPQGSEASNSQIMALASQFGVNVPGGGEEASPAFYTELLTSREILLRAAVRSYDVEGKGTVYLRDLLEIENEIAALRDQKVVEWLREAAVAVSTGRETGTVTIAVTTEWPDLSQAIASYLLEEVSSFNLNTRQSQAASERAFIEARVKAAEGELQQAEDALQAFLEANRQFENSPTLVFRHDALMREVSLRQAVLTTLVQSYEQARISEVRDTPVITVLQSPYLPPGPDPRRLKLAAVVGIALGGMMGIVFAFLVEAFRRPVQGDPAREDFQRAWDALIGSLPFVRRRKA